MQDVTTNKTTTLLLKEILKKTGTGGSGGGSTGGLTNTELRASPVTISGTVAVSNLGSGGLTDGQLRATAVPVSASSLPLPTGAATESTLAAASAKLPVSLGAKTGANSLSVVVASDQTVPVSAASLPLPSGAATSALQTTGNSSLSSIDGKLGTLGQKASSGSTPVVIASDQSIVPTNPRAAATGGATPYKLISAATTNATSLKGSAGQLYSIIAIGTTANIRYLKFYNKASAPTVGTDVPVLTIPIPGNTQGAGVAMHFTVGTVFSTGIAFAITAGVADADSAAVGASDVVVNLTYA